MPKFIPRAERDQYRHYAVRIQVFDRDEVFSVFDETKPVAAKSIEQAIRSAGMSIVQRIRKESATRD